MRSTLLLAVVVSGAAAVAQLAGVTGTVGDSGNDLVFGQESQQWLVQFPDDTSSRASDRAMSKATDDLGGGRTGGELPGGWREVKLSDTVTSAEAEATFASEGAINVEPIVPRVIYDLDEPGSASDPAGAMRASASDEPDVIDDPPAAFASQTSFRDRLRAGTMNATRLREQWALNQDSDIDIDGTEAWQASTGAGVTVAAIDTGSDASHPDLRGRVLDGVDFSKSSTGATHDAVGHGTHVASIIAAGGVGMAGVAPDAKVLPLKVFKDSPSSFSMEGYIKAIYQAVDSGAKVINISLGCGGVPECYSQAEFNAISYANDHGVLIVAAAGNGDSAGRGMNNDSASTPDYPSNYDLPNIVSVTSSTKIGGWSTWGNYGQRNVDLAAPGESILAATPGTGYKTITGTSFSAPIVSGALALLAAADPRASVDDFKTRLLTGVDKVADLKSRTVSGGTLNANTSLRAAPVVADAGVTVLQQVAPVNRAKATKPPTMTWRMPAGWRSSRVEIRGGGSTYRVNVTAARRALAHPIATAWRSGTYSWRVLALDTAGAPVWTSWRTYSLAPRVDAWVTSGKLTRSGNKLRLRVGYAAMANAASIRIRVASGGKTIHNGRATRHVQHVRGSGYPRRGWFGYQAALSKHVRSGSKVVVYVTVASGGATRTYNFTARVK